MGRSLTVRVLLDTHAFLWWVADSRRLSTTAYDTIFDVTNTVYVSAASAWEIATKHRIGKLPELDELALDIAGAIASQNFEELPVTIEHAVRAGSLPGLHLDPFDRMLIAQAISRDLLLVSNEQLFDRYGVRRLW